MIKNKSTLAKLLAEEDIFVVHKQMETAYFNSKSRELGLPIWKDEEMTPAIYDLMVGHEIGHALWTPLDMLETAAIRKIDHGFVNILEDARIEKFAKRKYPGLVGVFKRGYNELAAKDFFGTAGKDTTSLNLIDRINLFFKGNADVTFSDEEKVWVDRAANTETTDEVLDLAEELYAWMEENMPEETKMGEEPVDGSGMSMPGESGEKGEENDGNSGDGESSDESDTGDDNSAGSDGSSDKGEVGDETADKTESLSGAGVSDNPDSSVGDGSPDSEGDIDSTVGGTNSTRAGSVPKATTDKASKDGLDFLRDKEAKDRIYANIPKVDLDKIIVKNKTLLDKFKTFYLEKKNNEGAIYWDKTLEEVENLKNDSKKTVAYMAKEFEMKKAADAYARASTSKTGSLDMGKLHTYKYNEDLFKKVTTLPGATNHGMVMVLDWSGSMANNLKGTLAQLYNLIWFCRRVAIPSEVFAFSDNYDRVQYRASDRDEWEASKMVSFKAGDVALNDFKLLNFFSSDLPVSDEMEMMHILWMYASRWGDYRDWSVDGYPYSPPANLNLGGTPLNDAIIAMMELLPKFKADTGVQKVNTIFLTDGASNTLSGIYDYKLDTKTGEHYEILTPGLPNHNYGSGPVNIILSDRVMNKTYEVSDITNDLLVILKNRVREMNVVGFFIAGSGKAGRVDKNTLYYLLPNEARHTIMEKIKFINKHKYLALDQLGYDEYYVLPGGNALAVENEGLSDELIGAGKAKLKSAFGKSMKGKVSSRQLLNKFVSIVA